MKKSWFDMTEDERKAALAQDRIDRQALLADAIENAPKYKAEAEQAKLDQATAQAAEQESLLKQAVRDSYVAANGSELGFEAAWPSLREEIVRQRTLENIGNKAASPDLVQRFIQRVNSR